MPEAAISHALDTQEKPARGRRKDFCEANEAVDFETPTTYLICLRAPPSFPLSAPHWPLGSYLSVLCGGRLLQAAAKRTASKVPSVSSPTRGLLLRLLKHRMALLSSQRSLVSPTQRSGELMSFAC